MTNLDSILKSRDITLPTKVHLVKAKVFPVVMYGCECGTIKKAEHRRIDAFELWCWRRLLSSLDYKEIKPVHPKGNQSWIFIGRVDAETETLILWPPDVKSWLIWKDPDLGKDWRQEEKGTTENEMVGWHHQLHVHEFEQALEIGDGQGNLMCCSPWCHRVCELTYYNAILKSTTRKQCQTLQVKYPYKTAFASLASCILRGSSSPDLLTGSIIPLGMRSF